MQGTNPFCLYQFNIAKCHAVSDLYSVSIQAIIANILDCYELKEIRQ
jgi:hypothetical protein